MGALLDTFQSKKKKNRGKLKTSAVMKKKENKENLSHAKNQKRKINCCCFAAQITHKKWEFLRD
jgi:hypothetical protein